MVERVAGRPVPEVLRYLEAIPAPALLMELCSKTIVAASRAATELLSPAGATVVGHSLEEFLAGEPSGALRLMAEGRINGYEVLRLLQTDRDQRRELRCWVHDVDSSSDPRTVLVLLATDFSRADSIEDDAPEDDAPRHDAPEDDRAENLSRGGKSADPADPRSKRGKGLVSSLRRASDEPPIVGTADANLVIKRISGRTEPLFDRGPREILGLSILTLVGNSSVAYLLAAIGEVTASGRGTTLLVKAKANDNEEELCQLLIVPLLPAPSLVFAFLPGAAPAPCLQSVPEIDRALKRLVDGVSAVQSTQRLAFLASSNLPGFAQLTPRELDVASRLLTGDRVPVIAASLYVSKSTIRNHLSSIYHKLGVSSQQELVHALRDIGIPPTNSDSGAA